MRYTGVFALITISLAACSGPQPDSSPTVQAAPSEPSSTGPGEWVTLFDGSNLDAFMPTGDANWAIEGDTVGASSGTGMLVTRSQYDSFEMDLEFWVDVPANSGIFIRCADPEGIGADTCYEVNIFDTRGDQTYRTGGIVNYASPQTVLNTGGRWNRYEIMADGTRLHVVLNGEEMVDVEDETFAAGHIGLQYGSGTVIFRNVRIRTL